MLHRYFIVTPIEKLKQFQPMSYYETLADKIKEDLNETNISNKKLVFKMAGNGVSFLKIP